MKTKPKFFCDFLRSEFAARCRRNGKYSQAAFARDIGLSKSLLSEVFSGKHALSLNKAEKICAALGLKGSEKSLFCDSAEAESSRSKRHRLAARNRLRKHQSITKPSELRTDRLAVIGEWHHLAIMEVLRLTPEGLTEAKLSISTGLHAAVVRESLLRLERAGLASRSENNWQATNERLVVKGGVPSATLKLLHEQLISKAKASIYSQDISRRFVSSAIMGIPQVKLPEFFARLDSLRSEFCDALHAEKDKDRVYGLTIQFFDLKED